MLPPKIQSKLVSHLESQPSPTTLKPKLKRDKHKQFFISPSLEVYYLIPKIKKLTKRTPEFVFNFVLVSIVLIVGVFTGSYLVWESRFGEANKIAEQEDYAENTDGPWVKQLDFNTDELTIVANMLPLLIEENRHEPTPAEILNTQRKEKLKDYFLSRKSPFANSDETLQAFLDSKNMKLMIAISFVESTMGKRCYYNNCSGIGGYPPDLRKYDSHEKWIEDFDSLLERRYKGIPIEKFMGLYVQPGSPNWINGVRQILKELKQLNIE